VGQVFKSGSNGLNQAAKVASGKGGRKMPPIHRTYEKMSIDARFCMVLEYRRSSIKARQSFRRGKEEVLDGSGPWLCREFLSRPFGIKSNKPAVESLQVHEVEGAMARGSTSNIYQDDNDDIYHQSVLAVEIPRCLQS
jgi:hypothetical protein